jgi:hypothetical protein
LLWFWGGKFDLLVWDCGFEVWILWFLRVILGWGLCRGVLWDCEGFWRNVERSGVIGEYCGKEGIEV